MPIKPENRARYPADWKQIRAEVLKRASYQCEGSPAYPHCRVANGSWRNNDTGHFTSRAGVAFVWEAEGQSVTLIVLTIGHLDHTPENCDLGNLRAWCQRCHLSYDARHHAETSYRSRRAGRAIEMFE
jgi:hypothetical protein